MHVTISDILTGSCELTGRANSEIVSVTLEPNTPEILMVPAELVKLLRLKKKQESVNPSNLPNRKEPLHDQKLPREQG